MRYKLDAYDCQPTKEKTPSDPALLRKLGAFELLLHGYSVEHPRHFCIVAEVQSKKSPIEYRNAFDEVQKRHALLSASISNGADGELVFNRCDEPISVVFERRFAGLDWRSIVEKELASEIKASDGPLMRATMLYGRPLSIVVLTFHHAIADGLSAAYIIRDLMEALEGRELPALPLSKPMDHLAAERVQSDGAGIAMSKASDQELQQLRCLADAPLWRPFKGDRPSVSSLSLSRSFTGLLLTKCRSNGTTVQGALCAAIVCSLANDLDQQVITVANAISRRRHLGAIEGICTMLADLEPVQFQSAPRLEFWDIAREAIESLKAGRTEEALRRRVGMLQSVLPREADPELAAGIFASMQYDVVLANLGNVPIPRKVGGTTLKTLWGPFVQGRFTNERVIGAATIGGQLTIVQTSPRHIYSFLEKVRQELIDACI